MNFTEEPDYFETQSEREIEEAFFNSIDSIYRKEEKQKRQKVEKVKAILDTHNIEYYQSGNIFKIYVEGVYQFKECKKLFTYGKSLKELGYFNLTYFEDLPNDYGIRYFMYHLY